MPVDDGYRPQPLPARVRAAVRARGVRPVAGDLARYGTRFAAGLRHLGREEHGGFDLAGERYGYRFHPYKRSWLTERAVEVPVAERLVERAGDVRVLEVGHVLGHFGPVRHTVVDRYERAPGVLNRDVLDLGDLGPFDLIVAVSTLEHVGWDEEPRDPDKPVRAVAALRKLLAPGGRLVLTVPAGYNPVFDGALRSGRVPLARASALRRDAGRTTWREVGVQEAWETPYDFLLYSARAVVVAEVDASPS